MTPLDDELRSTLSARAAAVTATPEPLAGIEARVSRIRRRRVAVAVSGAVAAVAAVALAVPALVPDRATRVQPGTTASPGALPANAMRQTSEDSGTLTAPGTSKVVDAWTAKHPGTGGVYVETLLDGTQQTTPPVTFQVLQLWRAGGPAYAVVAQDVTTTPVLVRDSVVPKAVAWIDGVVMTVDGKPFVVYALADGVSTLVYDRGDGRTKDVGTFPSPGAHSGVFDRIGPAGARDTLSATLSDGSTVSNAVWTEPIDDYAPPANVLTWEPRGDASLSPSVDYLLSAYARLRGASRDDVAYRAAYSSETGSVLYTIGQAWVRGDSAATTVSYETGGTDGSVLRQYGKVGGTPPALVALITGQPGTSTDLLVVVPRPGIGQVSYSPSSSGAFQPIASGRSDLNGIGYVNRDPGATGDRLELLDGDGILDHAVYRGPVSGLLCGASPCSQSGMVG